MAKVMVTDESDEWDQYFANEYNKYIVCVKQMLENISHDSFWIYKDNYFSFKVLAIALNANQDSGLTLNVIDGESQ